MELEQIYRRVIGMDIHQAKISACAVSEQVDRSVVVEMREFGGYKRDRRALAQWAKSFTPEIVVMESTGIYWKSPYAALESVSIAAWVVNARHVLANGRQSLANDGQPAPHSNSKSPQIPVQTRRYHLCSTLGGATVGLIPLPVPAMSASPESPAQSAAAVPWLPLLTLVSAFALSQAFRTVTAMMATGLQQDFGLSTQALGLFAATFAFSFGLSQFVIGVALDFYGLRRTWLCTFPLAILGALTSALAPNYAVLVLGQALIGIGCSPAFVVCTLFIARRFPAHRFAAISGVAMGMGGLGLVLTGTPLAWLIHVSSWRMGFAVLAGLACISWLFVQSQLREDLAAAQHRPDSLEDALHGFGALFLLPQTWAFWPWRWSITRLS